MEQMDRTCSLTLERIQLGSKAGGYFRFILSRPRCDVISYMYYSTLPCDLSPLPPIQSSIEVDWEWVEVK